MSDRWRELYAEECARKERLEGELAAERKMREEVEEELYQERLQHTAAVTRAEQAERERDEWSRKYEQAESDMLRMQVERDEWSRRFQESADIVSAAVLEKERAEADNAALVEALREAVDRLGEIEPRLPGLVHDKDCQSADENWADECDCSWVSWKKTAISDHPGAALLEERRRIQKTLDETNVPSEADEHENGRTCDFAGRVELLATWGRRGWDEYRRLKDAEAALLEYVRALEKVRLHVSDVSDKIPDAEWEYIKAACDAADASKERPIIAGMMSPDVHTALLERLRAADKVLAAFREYEWERMDWQGTCPFRRHQDVRCRGTDGHGSAVGTPKPVPHSEHCPYHALAALKERKP